ncbi:hypothetical protein PQX77_008169 [Marasmius sp. AFHP31]|nr:hypothetical protein PQX77_008169 [Marasmius sp. AFHP31]
MNMGLDAPEILFPEYTHAEPQNLADTGNLIDRVDTSPQPTDIDQFGVEPRCFAPTASDIQGSESISSHGGIPAALQSSTHLGTPPPASRPMVAHRKRGATKTPPEETLKKRRRANKGPQQDLRVLPPRTTRKQISCAQAAAEYHPGYKPRVRRTSKDIP